MINYRNLAGGEVSYWNGIIYFWMPFGVYTVNASLVRKYVCDAEPRQVTLSFVDTETDFHKVVSRTFSSELDDFELIYRFISGSSSCDCVRGHMIYGPTQDFECNEEANRFVLRKLAIRGEDHNCVLTYKGYI